MYMINPKTGKDNYCVKPYGALNDEPLTIRDVRDREIKNYKKVGGTDYLSWIICDNSPFKSKCKGMFSPKNNIQGYVKQKII